MSSHTSPISNRLRISRGWNNSYFPQNKNEYSRNISLWLKLFLLIKVYLEIKNFKLVSCELKITNNNRKLLFLNLFKCLKEKKKKKNKSKIQHSFQWPLQRLKYKKAIFLLYKNLKKIKKITNLKYSSVLFYNSKNIWLKKSPLLKKLLINKFQRAIIKFSTKVNEKETNLISLKKDIFDIIPNFLLAKRKQLHLLEKKYIILSKFYNQIFFSNIKKQKNVFKNSYLLFTQFLSFKLIDLKNRINKLNKNINLLLKRKNLYKKKNTFYFIQKTRLRIKNKIKKIVYLTRQEKIKNFLFSKLLIKRNKRSRKKRKLISQNLFIKKNKILFRKKLIEKKKIKKKHIRFILKKQKKQIYLFNLYFQFFKNRQINGIKYNKNIGNLKHLISNYIGYYSLKILNKKLRDKNIYTLINKNIIVNELKSLFIQKLKKKKLKFSNNIKVKKIYNTNKNNFNNFFHQQMNKNIAKIIKLSFYSIKKKIKIRKLKRKKIKKIWQVFKKWDKKNKQNIKIKLRKFLKNKKNNKFINKKTKKNFNKFKKWKTKKNKYKKSIKISKKTKQKYFIYKTILVQFQLQNLIKEYIYKYFKIYCIVHVIDVISKFKNSKLFYLALTKFYGPKQEYWKKKKKKNYLYLNANSDYFVRIKNRLKKWSLRNKKLKTKKVKNKWKIISKRIKKTLYSNKFKLTKIKKSFINTKLLVNHEKKIMYHNIRNKSLLARFLPILAIFAKNLNPNLLSEQIAKELEGTKNHWPVIYTIRNILRTYQIKQIRGYRIGIYGKINSSDRTRLFYINSGRIPIQSFSEKINYASSQARARAGTFGIKIWIF